MGPASRESDLESIEKGSHKRFIFRKGGFSKAKAKGEGGMGNGVSNSFKLESGPYVGWAMIVVGDYGSHPPSALPPTWTD